MPVFFYVLLFSIKLSGWYIEFHHLLNIMGNILPVGNSSKCFLLFLLCSFFVHWFKMALGQLVQQFIFPCNKCWIELNCMADENEHLDSSFDLAAWALEETTGENKESEGKAWITLSVTSSREEAKSHWGKQLWFNGCFEFRKIHLSFKKKFI